MSDAFRYWAFISYSHQDKAWADWLHKRLETYRVPQLLAGRDHWTGKIPPRLFPIFRDRDELPSSADLGGVLNEALKQSRYQIVICSPRAAQSRWVNEEIKFFKTHGGDKRVLAFIVDGEPRVGSERECFPAALRYKLDANGALTDERTEIIAADARKGRDERDGALLKLIAGILEVSFDDLKQRERQRRFWQRVRQAAIGVAAIAAILGSWRWFEHYRAAQALEARIEKLYDLGRRELLDHHEARAAVYLNEAYKLGRDTPALRFMLGQAMQAIDALEDIRINTGGAVRRPAFAPDSNSFITPTETKDGVIAQIWETATGKQLALLKDLPNVPLVTKFFPDGERVLVSGYTTETLTEAANATGAGAFTAIWDATTGRRLARFDGHPGRFGQFTDNAARLLVTSDSADAHAGRVWDLATGKLNWTLDTGRRVTAISMSPDGGLVVTGNDDGTAQLWDAIRGRQEARLPGRVLDQVVGALFTADSGRVLVFGARGDVRIWNVRSRELELAFGADAAGFNDVVLTRDGKHLITIGSDGYKTWDLERGILLFADNRSLDRWSNASVTEDGTFVVLADGMLSSVPLVHLPSQQLIATLDRGGAVQAALFSKDDRKLLVAHGNGRVEIWNMPIRRRHHLPHPRFQGRFNSLYATRPHAGRIMTGGWDGHVRIWQPARGEPDVDLDEHAPVIDAAYSPDQQVLATLTQAGKLRLRKADTLSDIGTVSLGPLWAADPIVFSPDSTMLAVLPDVQNPASMDQVIWNTADGTQRATLALGCKPSALTFVDGGKGLVAGCLDGALQSWSLVDYQKRREFPRKAARVWRIAADPGNDRIAVAAIEDPTVSVFDLKTGATIASIGLPESQFAESLAFAGDGRFLAMGSNTGKVMVHDFETRRQKVLGFHTREVQHVQFLPSGLLLSWRADKNVRAWDPTRGESLGAVAWHDWNVWTAQPMEDAQQLLTGGLDGVASIWDLPSESRSASEIDARLRCRAPWRLVGDALAPASTSPTCSEKN